MNFFQIRIAGYKQEQYKCILWVHCTNCLKMEVKAGKHFWEITNFTKGQKFANSMKTVLQMSAVSISPTYIME